MERLHGFGMGPRIDAACRLQPIQTEFRPRDQPPPTAAGPMPACLIVGIDVHPVFDCSCQHCLPCQIQFCRRAPEQQPARRLQAMRAGSSEWEMRRHPPCKFRLVEGQ